MTLDDKAANGCRCMGLAVFEHGSCNFPGLGQYIVPELSQAAPLEPAALAPKPRMGATLCCAGLRMSVQAGMTDEMWAWLAGLGWRELRSGENRLHYTSLSTSLVNRLYDRKDAVVGCTLEDFDAVMAESPVGSFDVTPPEAAFINRRQSLAAALHTLVDKSGREVTIRPDDPMPFAAVRCDTERCTQCMACLNHCRWNRR